ncbi:HAD hydrolase-like protein [Sorangium sp. So ce590]|uniref:HAD hydrolase-like protein n=1 Tax=Sorangium sp. So ce590 TaxID=3133317 RepID=UPI003F6491C5
MDLLFDLDGTLTEPALGIILCFQHALQKMGRAAPDAGRLRRLIGPPLRSGLAELLATDDAALIEEALGHFRERFATTGMFENEVYPDVPAGLAGLGAAGHRLWVVTSKPGVYAQRIVEHFGLARHFRDVYGAELSGERSEKGELIRHVLEREGLDPRRTWMIGDRRFDVAGGRANGTSTVGVLWGHGSEEELRGAGADRVVASVAELLACL